MTAIWRTHAPDGPMTDTHRAALAEWSRLRATGALPEPADEQVVSAGPAVLLYQSGPIFPVCRTCPAPEKCRVYRGCPAPGVRPVGYFRPDWGGYPGPGLDLPAYRCRRESRRRRLARLAVWLARKAAREAREAALLTLGMAALRWDWLRARPRPALVALGLVAAALVAGWVGR